MSEVYIRSQNKEKLYRLGGNYACVEYGEYEDIKKKRGGAEADKKRHVICISDGCLEEIGEYATKERCLEVLDEIQKACVSYLFTAGGAGENTTTKKQKEWLEYLRQQGYYTAVCYGWQPAAQLIEQYLLHSDELTKEQETVTMR